jgi:hypothetical protein
MSNSSLTKYLNGGFTMIERIERYIDELEKENALLRDMVRSTV